MTRNQWIMIMGFLFVSFFLFTTVFGALLGSALGALLWGAIVAYGAGQPGGTGWKN